MLERGSIWPRKLLKMENLAVGLDGRTGMLDCRKDSGDLGCRTRSVNPVLLFGALAARSARGMEKEEKNDMLRGKKGDFSDRLGESRNSMWI